MYSGEDKLTILVERAINERSMKLADFLYEEELDEYELGCVDILYAYPESNAIVPCENYMILAREYYDEKEKHIMAEYALYTQHDRDGQTLLNSLNVNAVYKLESVCKKTFPNMAVAISHAVNQIYGKDV